MPRKLKQPKVRRARPAPSGASAGGSWLALVAATTFGFGAVDCVQAVVSAAHDLPVDGSFRLVVQSYRAAELDAEGFPIRAVRPLASTQRAVTADELRRGVAVQVVRIGAAPEPASPRVVAWVEPGQPDLEFDALTARPGEDAVYGSGELTQARRHDELGSSSAHIVLRRRPNPVA